MVKSRKRTKNYLRLFIIECPSPLDAMESRAEASGVSALARLIGHGVHTTIVRSVRELRETCAYIGSISQVASADLTVPLCLHISAHGARDGLLFGQETLDWKKLLKVIQPILRNDYEGTRVLVLSSCEADQQSLTDEITTAVLEDTTLIPPAYIFCATGDVDWPSAAVGWTLLYHLIPNIDLAKRGKVKEMLDKIRSVDAACFMYFRWDPKTRGYKFYRPKSQGDKAVA